MNRLWNSDDKQGSGAAIIDERARGVILAKGSG